MTGHEDASRLVLLAQSTAVQTPILAAPTISINRQNW